MTASAIYTGDVGHRRLVPRPHAFRQRFFGLFLDLDELPDLERRIWFLSCARPGLVRFRRSDYLGPAHQPLREAVLDRVEGELGRRPGGALRMFTQLRTLGHVFNPVTFYYCHDSAGELDAVVAEITNTPWRERHAYVLDASRAARTGDRLSWSFDKEFHVSPFFDMNQVYTWSFGLPGEALEVHMTNREEGRAVFQANFRGTRRPLTAGNLARALLRHPLLPVRVHLAIYWQAFRLWLKRTPFFTHPDKRTPVHEGNPV